MKTLENLEKFISIYLSADSDDHIKIWPERCSMTGGAFQTNFGNIAERFHNDGTPYDFGSVMHYSPWACAKNSSLPVITKPDGSPITLNKTDTFSFWDIQQINYVYDCDLDNLKTPGEYCIKLESKCSETSGGSSISLFHNNVKIQTIAAGFNDFQHCLPSHWVDIENDTFKLYIDEEESSDVSLNSLN